MSQHWVKILWLLRLSGEVLYCFPQVLPIILSYVESTYDLKYGKYTKGLVPGVEVNATCLSCRSSWASLTHSLYNNSAHCWFFLKI